MTNNYVAMNEYFYFMKDIWYLMSRPLYNFAAEIKTITSETFKAK